MQIIYLIMTISTSFCKDLWKVINTITITKKRDVEQKKYSSTCYLPCYYLKLYGQCHAQPLHCQGKKLLIRAIRGTTGNRQVAKTFTLTEIGDLVGWGQLILILLLILVSQFFGIGKN
jgi:hypothetical protein